MSKKIQADGAHGAVQQLQVDHEHGVVVLHAEVPERLVWYGARRPAQGDEVALFWLPDLARKASFLFKL